MVRGFVQKWINNRMLLKGTFICDKITNSISELFDEQKEEISENLKAPEIDGIIYAPESGPYILKENNFIIVHPAFCAGVIEIKTTISNISHFYNRLKYIHSSYMDGPANKTMGIVISDKAPDKISTLSNNCYYHDIKSSSRHPIFVLFQEDESGNYIPQNKAIKHLIKAIYNNINPGLPNYI